MGAIKNNKYSLEETLVSLTAKAIAHPARVKILKILKDDLMGCRNTDLAMILNFSKPNVKNHLQFMKDADLLEINYYVHFYDVRLNNRGLELADLIFTKGGIN